MPIYEYRCQDCQRRFSVFWRSFSTADDAKVFCKRCGSHNVSRLVSKIRVLRSESDRLEALADPAHLGDFDENDPKSIGRFMRSMVDEMGDEAGELGDDFEEVMGRLESGESPEEIESNMPGLPGGDSGIESGADFD